jgi:glyceraldehyde 3-phosphate dehydrogenase
MAVKVGINGFGRIGRNILRTALGHTDIEFVAVNDLTDAKTLAHLLKYDSILGNLTNHTVTAPDEDTIAVDGHPIRVFKVRSPGEIDWASTGAQIVIESTGLFTNKDKAVGHLRDSVKKVIISAPAKNEDLTIVLGVNEVGLRSGAAPRRLECFLHDELPGSGGQSHPRGIWYRKSHHDDRA